MYAFYNLIQKMIHHRYMIRVMALRELKKRYAGSMIGLFWSVIHPMIMVAIYTLIFQFGFKSGPQNGVPFVVWFFCAFVPWTTFNEMILSTTSSVSSNSTLIKKTLFPSEILPIIYIVSSGINHLLMLMVLIVIMYFNGIGLSLYSLQFIYYWFAMIIMMAGMGWLLSSVNVFFRDTSQLVNILFQLWFWGIPLIWHMGMVPEKYHFYIKLNPMYYIIEGYRSSFLRIADPIDYVPFWENIEFGLYYWLFCIPLFLLGGWVFRRLKPEFADVL